MTVSMRDVVDALADTYRDDGIAIWLSSTHVSGRFKGGIPIMICRTVEGRAEVLRAAEDLAGGPTRGVSGAPDKAEP